MKIVVLDGYVGNPGDLSWEPLERLGDVIVYPRSKPEEIIERALPADALLTNKVVFDRKLIEALPNLKYIGVIATGFNIVDIEAANERGIIVANVPAYSTASVAQVAFAHLLNMTTHVEHYTRVIASEYAQQKYVHLRLKYTITGYQGFETGYEYSCIIDNLVVAGREACSNPTGCTSAIVTHNSARVAWNKVNDALNYDIRYRVASEMDWTVIEGVEGTVDATYSNILYYQLTNLQPSTTYEIQVKSECSNEWPTDVVTFITQANPCSAPVIALADGYPKLSGWVQFEVTQNEGMTSCQVACKEHNVSDEGARLL